MNRIFIILAALIIPNISYANITINGASVSGTTKFNKHSSYETSSGTLIDGFENVANWTTSGTGGSISQNTGRSWGTVRESDKSISLITDQASTVQMVKDLGSSNDFSTAPNFLIWVNPLNQTLLTSLNVYFSSMSDFSKNFKYNMPQNGSTYNAMWPRFNRVLMPKNSFVNTGSESWSAIRYIKIEQVTTGPSEVIIDGLYHSYILDKPKLIMAFDDGLSGVIDYAYPKMHSNGQRGVAFINLSNIGTAQGMTRAELDVLFYDGWDIANHNGPGADTLTLEQVSDYIDDGYSTLSQWGYTSTAKFYAYPSGQWQYPSYGMIDKLSERHIFARSVNQINVNQSLPVLNENDPYGDQSFYLGAGNFLNGFSTSSATVCGWIDENITAGGLYILTFHNIVSGTVFTAFQYSNTKFNEISDCIKNKVDAGTLDLITLSDLYNSYLR